MRLFSPALFLAACTGGDDTDKPVTDTSPVFEDSAPAVTFLGPADGAGLREGATVTFTAQVADEETPDASLQVAWTSTLDGVLGGATTVAGGIATMAWTDGLSEGAHTLIVSVTDEAGNSASDQVSVTVVDNVAPTIAITSPPDGSAYEAGDTVEIVVAGSDDADDYDDLTLTWGGDTAGYSPPTSLDASGTASFYMTDLEAGSVSIRVTITDTDGASATDEILLSVTADDDGDGFTSDDDCDDTNPSVYPGATERCDDIDQDCDGLVDDEPIDGLTFYVDVDGDGYGDPSTTGSACELTSGFSENGADCDDAVAAVNPGAAEVCDTLDNNCNGLTDESSATDASTWYIDNDLDGFGTTTATTVSCTAPTGYAATSTDCDDRDGDVFPGATETCDDDDNDCDGTVDEDDAFDARTWYLDADSDGYGTSGTTDVSCDQPAGYVTLSTDCDDGDRTVSPAATETCDGEDDDCDGTVDNDATDATIYYDDDDADGYGDPASSTASCSALSGKVTNAGDCNDATASVSPGATEVCDSLDNDCDGATDESGASGAPTWYVDYDLDGFGTTTSTTTSCSAPSGYVSTSTDCDDRDGDIYPGATEVCDDDDNDCDGTVDEDDAFDARSWYLDADSDGYGASGTTDVACDQPSGYVTLSTDCDDTDRTVSPAATETCDGEDDDCDGTVDDNATDATTWYDDDDSDGYGDAASATASCSALSGKVTNSGDCNDATASANPGASEVCDTIDNDCDGTADESSATDADTWYADADGDGYGSTTASARSCTQPSGYVADNTDCNDTDATASPVDSEVCDGIDNDCDGSTDESTATDAVTWYRDGDGDGYGTTTTSTRACDQPTGYVSTASDCDDGSASASPGVTEVCDSVDNDCDGSTDESSAADATIWYVDADADGYGANTTTSTACTQPSGYVATATDCNDANASISPGDAELCDDLDNDCDGSTDESSATDADTWYADDDGDGYGDASASANACSQPTGYVATSTDCDDDDAYSYPGAAESCDSADNDCDGSVDESVTTTWYRDNDGDGYGTTTSVTSCTRPTGYTSVSTDCDDTDSAIYPGGTEICDGDDNDCDGTTDEEVPTWYRDADADGYGNSAVSTTSCTQPSNYVSNSEDCDDADAAQSPAEDEICGNGVDDDCDGATDDTTAVDTTTWYADADDDGYGDPDSTTEACTAPTGYVADFDDCDDTDPDTNPSAEDTCDGLDNDCDGINDAGYSVPGDYATISAAITAASAGDAICVAAGTYYGPVNFGGKDLIVEGMGPDTTFIDVNGGKVSMTTGLLSGFTLQDGNTDAGSALNCTTGVSGAMPELENIVFTDNQCEAASSCQGIVYLSNCDMTFTDVTFEGNDISPAAGTVTGGAIYAVSGSDIRINGLDFSDNIVASGGTSNLAGGVIYLSGSTMDADEVIVTGNTFSATNSSADVYAWLVYAGGSSTTSYTSYFDHVYVAENTVTAGSDILGGIYANTNVTFNATWFEALDNDIGSASSTDYIYGGLAYFTDSAQLTMRQFVVAGNAVRCSEDLYGGLFGGAAYTGTTSAYDTGAQYLIFGDIVGNTIAAGTGSADYVYGGVAYGDYYDSSSSLGWDMDMVSVVDNTVTAYSSSSYVLGSVYYDDTSSYSYFTDFDYCNVYNNSGTAFYNHTDPTGSSGNVAYDPLYSDDSLASAVYWDLTLQASSPVRNAGNPSSTYLDPDGTYAAIGAYGGPYADDW